MFVNANQVKDLNNGSKPTNGWSNVTDAFQKNNVQTFRRIEFKKAKTAFASNGLTTTETNGVKKVPTEAVKKPTPKDTSVGLFDSSKVVSHVQWKQVARVGPGFFNDGNTCYLNSTLQCLMYTPALAQTLRFEAAAVLRNFRQGQENRAILQHFQKLVEEVWTSPAGKTISPRSMVSNIRRIGKQFKPFRQEDAHEYLRQLLDCMHEEVLKVNGVKLSDGKIAETTVMSRIFGGSLCNTLTCLKCNYNSKTFNHFQDVSLDITSGINSVPAAIEYFTKAEYLSHGNEWKCDQCKMKVKAKKQMTFSQLPNVLVLHLKRFSYNGKNNKPITFSDNITVTKHNDGVNKKVNYTLHGVVVHHGSSTHSGHYIAFVKAPNGIWYEMNDSHVSVASLNKVLSCQAYILFYSRVVPVATATPTPAPTNGVANPVTATEKAPNGVVKSAPLTKAVVDTSADVGVIVKPKAVETKPVTKTVLPIPKVENGAVKTPNGNKSDSDSSSSSSGGSGSVKDSDSDDSDSDFEEPSDLDQVKNPFDDVFAERLPYRIPKAFRFSGKINKLTYWRGNRGNIREIAAEMKKAKELTINKVSSDSSNSESSGSNSDSDSDAAPIAPMESKKIENSKSTVTRVETQKEFPRIVTPAPAVEPTNQSSNGFKKPSNVVIHNNGVRANGETVKNLLTLSNRVRDVNGEGAWDSVSKELADEAHAINIKQRREEQKERNAKRPDAWNQKLDEGRVKKVKVNPSAYEAAFARGQQPDNQFQKVQNDRGNSREAYFEAGSAPFEKKRKHSEGMSKDFKRSKY